MRRITIAWTVIVTVFFLPLANGFAQEGHSGLGFGLRAGLGLDPDQFALGGQFSLGKKLGIARVVPSIDLGFGDNLTTVAFNTDFLLRLIVEDANFGFYGGAGPTVALFDFNRGGSDWKVGLSVVAGTQLPLFRNRATNLEARFSIGNIPDFRLLFVVVF